MATTISSDFTSVYKNLSELSLTDKNLTASQMAKCIDRSSWVRKEIIRIVTWLRGKGWNNEKKFLEIINQQGKTLGENTSKMKQYSCQISEIMAGAHYITPKPSLTEAEMLALNKISKLIKIFIAIPKPGQEPASQLFKELREVSEQADAIFKVLKENPPPTTKSKGKENPVEEPSSPPEEEKREPVKPKGNPLIEKFSDGSKELLTKFLSPLAEMIKEPIKTTQEEFDAIEKLAQEELTKEKGFSCDLSKIPPRNEKNRFQIVLPFDSNCIGTQEDGSDYINASPIRIGDRRYISTQGPMPKIDKKTMQHPGTVEDFLNMAHQQNAKIIVCLVMDIEYHENGLIEKYPKYWDPTFYPFKLKDDSIMTYDGEIEVANDGTHFEERERIVERTFTISKDNASKKIIQLHYENWPDKGAPDVTLFLKLLESVKKHHEEEPIICHCNAGIGRSGTFIAADSLCSEIDAKMKEGKNPEQILINTVERVVDMRTQRLGMVCTVTQFQAIKDTVVKHVKPVQENAEKDNSDQKIDIHPEGGQK